MTKTLPKEMLPLIDRPSIDFVVEEFIESGIDEILIITSRRKKTLEDYFDREVELESIFNAKGDAAKLGMIDPPEAEILFKRQQEMRGTGHATLQAKAFVGDEPFVVAYPDDLHFGSPPLAKQLIDVYRETGCSVLATIHDPPNIGEYASLALAEDDLHVVDMIEKAPPGQEPSKEASIGRFLYNEGFIQALEEGWRRHLRGERAANEYYHVDGLKKQMEDRKVVYCRFTGDRFDTGYPEGFIRAMIRYASTRPEYAGVLKEEVSRL